MINCCSLNRAWVQGRQPSIWARCAQRLISWCLSLLDRPTQPCEFLVDEKLSSPETISVSRVPLAMEDVWKLIREGLVQTDVASATLPLFQATSLHTSEPRVENRDDGPEVAAPVIPLPLLRLAEADADALWDLMDVTVRFGDWGAEPGRLLREAESLVDRHEDELQPWLVSRANRLMSELRDGLLSENRVIAHVRGRELSQLLALVRGELRAGSAVEPELDLACVEA